MIPNIRRVISSRWRAMVGAFGLLLLYGVVVIIFRLAFGVELPRRRRLEQGVYSQEIIGAARTRASAAAVAASDGIDRIRAQAQRRVVHQRSLSTSRDFAPTTLVIRLVQLSSRERSPIGYAICGSSWGYCGLQTGLNASAIWQKISANASAPSNQNTCRGRPWAESDTWRCWPWASYGMYWIASPAEM